MEVYVVTINDKDIWYDPTIKIFTDKEIAIGEFRDACRDELNYYGLPQIDLYMKGGEREIEGILISYMKDSNLYIQSKGGDSCISLTSHLIDDNDNFNS